MGDRGMVGWKALMYQVGSLPVWSISDVIYGVNELENITTAIDENFQCYITTAIITC